MSEEIKETPTGELEQGEFKIKKKPKKLANKKPQETVKLDLAKKEEPKKEEVKQEIKEDAVQGETTESVQSSGEKSKESREETKVEVPHSEKEETVATITEITEKPEAKEEVKAPEPEPQPEINLPENVEKLVNFMKETGGDINDYVRLNADYTNIDDTALLKEYYKQTKPHLNSEEIDFLMEDYFSFDEDVDDEIDVKRKKLALKEQVAQAKQHLDSAKSKYYEDIKMGSKLTSEQQKAIDFFNRYNKESKEQEETQGRLQNAFRTKTEKLFNDNFKGFEYNVGEKKFRFNVKNAGAVKDTQSDVNNFVKKFLNKNNEMEDAKGYHKALYTAMNSDAIAKHFYEQGKADALKESVAKSKNISMDPRQSHGVVEAGGIKVKVLGDTSEDFKFRIKNKNK